MKSKWFDENGWLIGEFPPDCVNSCSASGPVDNEVDYWVKELNFNVPRDKAIDYLKSFGSWPLETDEYDKGLNDMSDRELAEKVLWIACGEINDEREWCGLVN